MWYSVSHFFIVLCLNTTSSEIFDSVYCHTRIIHRTLVRYKLELANMEAVVVGVTFLFSRSLIIKDSISFVSE